MALSMLPVDEGVRNQFKQYFEEIQMGPPEPEKHHHSAVHVGMGDIDYWEIFTIAIIVTVMQRNSKGITECRLPPLFSRINSICNEVNEGTLMQYVILCR